MDPHHEVWLSNHPGRDKAWLKRMTAEGLSIHHIDGNHENNDPNNLVLIELDDHLRLHCIGGKRIRTHPVAHFMKDRQKEGIAKAKAEGKYIGRRRAATKREKDARALELIASGYTVSEAAREIGVSRQAIYRAAANK